MDNLEDRIRDELASRLDLLERGLALVKTNYHLPNSEGTRGFVDILARDRTGSFVVIELKRSNKAAREALHEVMKYKELLRREKGIDEAEISAMIVSTEWKELISPFSRLRRNWDSSLRGYKLTLSPDSAVPIAASEVEAQPDPRNRRLTPVHALLSGQRGRAVEDTTIWDSIRSSLNAVGIDDLVGFTIVHPNLPSMLHVVLGEADSSDPRTTALDYLSEDLPEDGLEVPEGYVVEYRALTHVLLTNRPFGYTVSHPDKFEAMLEGGGWQVETVSRSGVFDRQADLYSDKELVRRAIDGPGQSDVKARGAARLSHIAAWKRSREHISRTLAGNKSWTGVVNLWLDEAEGFDPKRTEIAYTIFNPCDILTTLVYGWPSQLLLYAPQFSIEMLTGPDQGRVATGVLVWNGVKCDDVQAAIEVVYPSGSSWHLAKNIGGLWDTDARILKSLGLSYGVFEFQYGEAGVRLIASGKNLTRERASVEDGDSIKWKGIRPFPEFVKHHAVQIEELVRSFRSRMIVNPSGGYEVIVDGL